MNVISDRCLQSLVLVVAGASKVQRRDENKIRREDDAEVSFRGSPISASFRW
jgi:hypothetical protein